MNTESSSESGSMALLALLIGIFIGVVGVGVYVINLPDKEQEETVDKERNTVQTGKVDQSQGLSKVSDSKPQKSIKPSKPAINSNVNKPVKELAYQDRFVRELISGDRGANLKLVHLGNRGGRNRKSMRFLLDLEKMEVRDWIVAQGNEAAGFPHAAGGYQLSISQLGNYEMNAVSHPLSEVKVAGQTLKANGFANAKGKAQKGQGLACNMIVPETHQGALKLFFSVAVCGIKADLKVKLNDECLEYYPSLPSNQGRAINHFSFTLPEVKPTDHVGLELIAAKDFEKNFMLGFEAVVVQP